MSKTSLKAEFEKFVARLQSDKSLDREAYADLCQDLAEEMYMISQAAQESMED